MIEIVVILALVLLLAWEHYQNRLERNKLMNALISKNSYELANLEHIEKQPKEKIQPTNPDLIPIDELPDQAFYDLMHKETGRTEEEDENA